MFGKEMRNEMRSGGGDGGGSGSGALSASVAAAVSLLPLLYIESHQRLRRRRFPPSFRRLRFTSSGHDWYKWGGRLKGNQEKVGHTFEVCMSLLSPILLTTANFWPL